MPAEVPRPDRGATATLARSPGDAADLAQDFADRATARAAASVLHTQALAAAMIRAAEEAFPTDARGRAVRPRPAPDTRVTSRNNSDADYTNRAG